MPRIAPITLAAVHLLFAAPVWADAAQCAAAAEEAQRLRDESKLSQAKEKLLECSKSDCPKVVRTDCIGWLEKLKESVPSVVVRAKDASGGDANGKLFVDGKLVASQLDGSAVELDPGRHEIRVEFDGGEQASEKLTIAIGEKNRLVTLSQPAPGGNSDSRAPAAQRTLTEKETASAGPWVVGGIGVAGLLTFGVLEVLAQSEHADLKDGCGATRTCTEDELSAVRTKFIAAGVALGVGVVALGSGIAWKLLQKDAPADQARIEFAPTSGGGVFQASGTF